LRIDIVLQFSGFSFFSRLLHTGVGAATGVLFISVVMIPYTGVVTAGFALIFLKLTSVVLYAVREK